MKLFILAIIEKEKRTNMEIVLKLSWECGLLKAIVTLGIQLIQLDLEGNIKISYNIQY